MHTSTREMSVQEACQHPKVAVDGCKLAQVLLSGIVGPCGCQPSAKFVKRLRLACIQNVHSPVPRPDPEISSNMLCLCLHQFLRSCPDLQGRWMTHPLWLVPFLPGRVLAGCVEAWVLLRYFNGLLEQDARVQDIFYTGPVTAKSN